MASGSKDQNKETIDKNPRPTITSSVDANISTALIARDCRGPGFDPGLSLAPANKGSICDVQFTRHFYECKIGGTRFTTHPV